MKSKLTTVALYVACVSAAVLTLNVKVSGQAPTKPYSPGDVLSFTVTFNGESAEKLKWVQVHLDLSTPVDENQKPFVSYINANGNNNSSKPGVFEATTKIPDFIASGTYKLTVISAGADNINFQYREELPSITITVVNHDHFAKPKLKSVEKTSNP